MACVENTVTPEFEACPCPLCGAGDPRDSPYAEEPFRVVRCGQCRLWYLSPRLTAQATDALYRDDDYFAGDESGYTDYGSQERSLRRTFRRLLRRLEAMDATGGRLLEVGSGLGYLLDEARPYFAARDGIELSLKAAEAASTLSGATVHRDLDALPAEARYDCILALHVIEHIHDPVAFTKRLASHLAPGGTLVLAAPDMGSFWRRIMGRRWPSFKYPEHVSFFDADTMPRLFRAAGFEAVRPLPYAHDFPLSEILAKLHIPAPRLAGAVIVPLPATTVCCVATRPAAGPT